MVRADTAYTIENTVKNSSFSSKVTLKHSNVVFYIFFSGILKNPRKTGHIWVFFSIKIKIFHFELFQKTMNTFNSLRTKPVFKYMSVWQAQFRLKCGGSVNDISDARTCWTTKTHVYYIESLLVRVTNRSEIFNHKNCCVDILKE